jgi:predicted nuclease of predicted toxin-antitoxin system
MALLIDQNLPRDLERFLARDFPHCVHVRSLGLQRATDSEIWEFARTRGVAIVTNDSDFRHRSVIRGHPPKVILDPPWKLFDGNGLRDPRWCNAHDACIS